MDLWIYEFMNYEFSGDVAPPAVLGHFPEGPGLYFARWWTTTLPLPPFHRHYGNFPSQHQQSSKNPHTIPSIIPQNPSKSWNFEFWRLFIAAWVRQPTSFPPILWLPNPIMQITLTIRSVNVNNPSKLRKKILKMQILAPFYRCLGSATSTFLLVLWLPNPFMQITLISWFIHQSDITKVKKRNGCRTRLCKFPRLLIIGPNWFQRLSTVAAPISPYWVHLNSFA